MYNIYFLCRRLLSGFFLVFFSDNPMFQVTSLMAFSVINFIYQASERPFEGTQANCIELFNEFCILQCAYLMHVFLNVAAPPSFMVKIGWVFMGITSFNILTNVVVITVSKIIHAIRKELERRNKNKVLEI